MDTSDGQGCGDLGEQAVACADANTGETLRHTLFAEDLNEGEVGSVRARANAEPSGRKRATDGEHVVMRDPHHDMIRPSDPNLPLIRLQCPSGGIFGQMTSTTEVLDVQQMQTTSVAPATGPNEDVRGLGGADPGGMEGDNVHVDLALSTA
ncbi:hypothetical protein ACFWAY_22360 [Rhodococcus sp. NPDC059968]|uniref:hypothetical protein n=1 Tax=Rhodococcus sp. NPDC059968 TaxID=3347017 RepID=UPI00366EC879